MIVMGKLSQDAKPSGGCESSEGGKKRKMGKVYLHQLDENATSASPLSSEAITPPRSKYKTEVVVT